MGFKRDETKNGGIGMSRWELWLMGWVKLAQGFVLILTLGRKTTGWDIRFAKWRHDKKTRG